MARRANWKVKVYDLHEFNDWLHILSDLVVVKIYVGSTYEERTQFKKEVISILRS